MRSWPSVTTTSPAFRPRVTMTLSPTRRPVVTAIVSALPPERPLRPRTTVTLSPEAEVGIAVAGPTTAQFCGGGYSAVATFSPGHRDYTELSRASSKDRVCQTGVNTVV